MPHTLQDQKINSKQVDALNIAVVEKVNTSTNGATLGEGKLQGDYTSNGILIGHGRPPLKYNPLVKSLPATLSASTKDININK